MRKLILVIRSINELDFYLLPLPFIQLTNWKGSTVELVFLFLNAKPEWKRQWIHNGTLLQLLLLVLMELSLDRSMRYIRTHTQPQTHTQDINENENQNGPRKKGSFGLRSRSEKGWDNRKMCRRLSSPNAVEPIITRTFENHFDYKSRYVRRTHTQYCDCECGIRSTFNIRIR